MITIQPVYLHREFAEIVAAVNVKLIQQLQQVDPGITAVHYMFGHPLEIVNTIGQYDQSSVTRYNKYPLVAFFLDTDVQRGIIPGVYGEYNIHLAIIRECLDANQTANERDLTNFIPVLTPIYMELMNQINLRGDLFHLTFMEALPHKVTNRYYWGRSGLPYTGNQTNIFNDWVDAIEIQNLKLKVNTSYCPKQIV